MKVFTQYSRFKYTALAHLDIADHQSHVAVTENIGFSGASLKFVHKPEISILDKAMITVDLVRGDARQSVEIQAQLIQRFRSSFDFRFLTMNRNDYHLLEQFLLDNRFENVHLLFELDAPVCSWFGVKPVDTRLQPI